MELLKKISPTILDMSNANKVHFCYYYFLFIYLFIYLFFQNSTKNGVTQLNVIKHRRDNKKQQFLHFYVLTVFFVHRRSSK